MQNCRLIAGMLAALGVAAGAWAGGQVSARGPVDEAALIAKIDAAAKARNEHVARYTVTEHYVVYRGNDEAHAAAEMTVKTTYKKGVGKSYEVQSQSGSLLIQRFGLRPLLDSERAINDPAKVAQSWFNSDNYEMHLKPGVTREMGGRECVAMAMKPKRKASNMVDGTLWVDAKDASVVEIEGVASKNPSGFSGTTKMMRTYATITGYAMAQHARAESSGVFGRTVVTIDYVDYRIEAR